MEPRVSVERNRFGRPDQPWLVRCFICVAGTSDFFDFDFLPNSPSVKGWAPTWQIAMDYATWHALEHEKTRCQTCLHVPTQPLPNERKASCQ